MQVRKSAIEEWLKSGKSATETRRRLRRVLNLPIHLLPSVRLITYWGHAYWERKSVVNGIQTITLDEIHATLRSWRSRLIKCVEVQGHQFECDL